ncbi:TetR/AcrR family transcriptional regulator, partial [Streptomyces sp. P38-E01]|nr:TetR/AcrR family transcriptional regulator [Streptomyces tardus]
MMSQRSNGADASPTHPKPANAIPEEQILDAAYELLLAIGMQRMTMADIARYAGVSRATLYRRWGGVREVVGALITREWAALSQDVTSRIEAQPPVAANGARSLLVATVVEMARRIRTHPILRKIVDLDPDFLLPYLLRRRGTSTNEQLELLEGGVRAGMEDGSVRTGAPGLLARSVLLATWSFTLTAPALVDAPDGAGAELDRLDAELTLMLDRYLSPTAPPT